MPQLGDRFVNDPAYAFVYLHFFVNGGYKFLNSKVKCKSSLYVFEPEKELVSPHNDPGNEFRIKDRRGTNKAKLIVFQH